LDDGAVSRQHAQITQSHGTYYVEDLRSRNGTQLNDVDVVKPTMLQDGDVVAVSEHSFIYHAASHVSSSTGSGIKYTKPAFTDDDDRDVKVTVGDTGELDEDSSERSSIISRIDARSGSGVRLSVKPEVKLRAVLEIGKALGRVLNIDEVLPGILDALFTIYPQADQGFVALVDDQSELQIRAFRNRHSDDDNMSISRTIVNRTLRSGEAILSADASDDSRFASSESLSGLRIRSMMCVPLITQEDDRLGVIQITTFDLRSRFTEDDLDLLVNVASQCTLAVENSNLHHALLSQREMERELEFAMQVQLGFLPNRRPEHSDYDFAHYYEAAQQVGGDYFDYVTLPNGHIVVTVADVAGKGVAAALLMARLYSAARMHLLTSETPAEAMTGLNSEIATSGLGHRFITCAIVTVDPVRQEAIVVSAGHLPPVVRHADGNVELIESEDSGLPLGIIPDQVFQQQTYAIKPGDTWLMYTDGVTEAMKSDRELYGTSRLVEFAGAGPMKVADLITGIVGNMSAFVDGHPQTDDICIVGFQRRP
jgi:serine phosphatase RsbU (regulator of sigma subunit)